MFSCLPEGKILNWNPAAEELFGLGADEARQRNCWEIVAGLDVWENDYCSRHCPVREMVRRGRPVRQFRMSIRHASGSRISVRTMVLAPRSGDGWPEVIHLFDPLGPAPPPRDATAASG